MLATDLELPATTLARLIGHADAGFTLRVYARDARDEAAVVNDVLSRAAGAGIGVVSAADARRLGRPAVLGNFSAVLPRYLLDGRPVF